MATPDNDDLKAYCLDVAQRARQASADLTQVTGEQKQQWLRRGAQLLQERSLALTEANHADIKAAPDYGLTDAQVDRLRLTPERIDSIAGALREISLLPDPVGEIISSSIRPNGIGPSGTCRSASIVGPPLRSCAPSSNAPPASPS